MCVWGGGGGGMYIGIGIPKRCGYTRYLPPCTDIRCWPPKRVVHILLECFLVVISVTKLIHVYYYMHCYLISGAQCA